MADKLKNDAQQDDALPHDLPQEVLRLAVEQSALAISITDPQAHIIYTNPAFTRVTGYSHEEVTGQKESVLSYKVTPKIVYETMWAQLLRQRPWNGLLVNRRKDGNRYLADLTISPVVDPEGKTTHYLGMHRDVTEVHQLERQVQNQKAMIESVVDSAQVAIAVLNDQEHVILDNQEYKKLIGDLGKEPALMLLQALRAQMGAAFEQARNTGLGFYGREVQIDPPSHKPRWFSCSGTWIEEQDASADAFYEPQRRQYMLLTVQDITPLKEQQEALRVNSLRALMAEQERIQSLRETLSGAIFQLEGPFNMLAAAVRLLELNGHQDARTLVSSLQEALQSGNETLDLLRNSIPENTIEAVLPLSLNELIQDVIRITTPQILTESIVVEWHPQRELPAVHGRQRQLAMLVKHLIDNAVESIHDARGKKRELRISTLARPDYIELQVEDSGTGIPEEWRLKVFQPFFTTKGANHQHIGMGLTVAQEIVANHGGLIEIDPADMGGCLVRVQLPLPVAT